MQEEKVNYIVTYGEDMYLCYVLITYQLKFKKPWFQNFTVQSNPY